MGHKSGFENGLISQPHETILLNKNTVMINWRVAKVNNKQINVLVCLSL